MDVPVAVKAVGVVKAPDTVSWVGVRVVIYGLVLEDVVDVLQSTVTVSSIVFVIHTS
jgi:hypothetical protein